MEHYERKTVCDKLSKYNMLVNKDLSNDFIEVSEWHNGEGWDITIGGQDPFALTYCQLEAIIYLTKSLDVERG